METTFLSDMVSSQKMWHIRFKLWSFFIGPLVSAVTNYLPKKVLVGFLGNDQLKQVTYDCITGGCFDGLEKEEVNLNQGAEVTVCYMIARLTVDSLVNKPIVIKRVTRKKVSVSW
jgi:hypothetical protein